MLKTVQTITTFRNRLAETVATRRGPPLVRGPQFENRCCKQCLLRVKRTIHRSLLVAACNL